MKRLTVSFVFFAAALALPMTASGQAHPVAEEIDLNIVFEQITEADFRRSTSVSSNTSDLHVAAGATVEATKITLTLRNVVVKGRFAGSLEALERTLERRRPKR